MSEPCPWSCARTANVPGVPSLWDARLARRVVSPLKSSWVTPNHLTTVRLVVGIAGAWSFTQGSYGWSNLGALLVMLSNFLDHTDGELARISGKSSRMGHLYDLASDALVTVLLFTGIGVGVGRQIGLINHIPIAPALLGFVASGAIALIFQLRMRIEELAGKYGTQQASVGGFETEDILYLLPLVTLSNGLTQFLAAAAIGAPLFAIWVVFDYTRTMRLQGQPVP
jgi:phosphatidylglycerophosphate synthase